MFVFSKWTFEAFWNFYSIVQGRTGFIANNFGITKLLVVGFKKKDSSPIFGVLELHAEICHCSRTPKIGVPSFFLIFFGNKGHLPKLYNQKLARPQNMGAQLPVEQILNPKPCWRITHQFWRACASTVSAAKYVLLGVGRPYFADNRARGPLGVRVIGYIW